MAQFLSTSSSYWFQFKCSALKDLLYKCIDLADNLNYFHFKGKVAGLFPLILYMLRTNKRKKQTDSLQSKWYYKTYRVEVTTRTFDVPYNADMIVTCYLDDP